MTLIDRLWLGAALLLATLAPAPALAQGVPVFQMGTATPGHVAAFGRNGQVIDGSVAGLSELKLRGAVPLCIYDTIPNASYSLCFGASDGGVGLIAYNALGAAAPQNLNFEINGANHPFPGTGNGNMLGSVTTTINEPIVWNNTAGTLAKDGFGVQIVHSDTQTGPISNTGSPFAAYSNKANGVTAAYVNQCIYSTTCTDYGVFYDVFRSVLVAPAGTPATTVQNGYGSWIINSASRDPLGNGFPNTSNFWGGSVADADYAGVWGSTLILTDHKGQVVTANPSPRYLFGQEISFNFMSANSSGNGLQFTGQSLIGVSEVNAVALYHLDGFGSAGSGNLAKWNAMNFSADGATNYFARIGAQHRFGVIIGTVAGTTLSVSSVTDGIVSLGSALSTPTGGYIVAHLSGTLGGVGTYQVSASQTVASGTIYLGSDSQIQTFTAYKSSNGQAAVSRIQLDSFSDFQFIAPAAGAILLQADTAVIARISSIGLALNNSVALATTATGPFLALTASAGPPTGTPTIVTAGSVPCHYDRTNDKLWCHNGTAWKFAQMN